MNYAVARPHFCRNRLTGSTKPLLLKQRLRALPPVILDSGPRVLPSSFAAQRIITAWRSGRPIVPFLGAGISVSTGFPATPRLTLYLAKVQFALHFGLYRSRYPILSEGLETAEEHYIQHPSDFIADFGWPEMGQLNAALRSHLRKSKWWQHASRFAPIVELPRITSLHDAEQYILQQHLESHEYGIATLARQNQTPVRGDWSVLLDHLTEGQMPLTDALFTSLEIGRAPQHAHLFLAFLTQLLGIELILTLNFDTLLEQSLTREGAAFRVFDIHRDADLPHASLVRRQSSIVKLHGSAYGLRFGERLQYALDEGSRRRMFQLVPQDALLVVIGFSGWERRMMQLIRELARRGGEHGFTPAVMWLTQDPENDRSQPVEDLSMELKRLGLNSFEVHQICDAGSFMREVYSQLSSAFPSSRNRYFALGSKPVIARTYASPAVPNIIKKTQTAGVVIFTNEPVDALYARKTTRAHVSSWPSLAAAECVAYHKDRDCIWIDLENHQTVEAVVRDILDQIRTFDPGAPSLVLPTDPSSDFKNWDLVKAATRVREALQRGHYTLVFDSLESFCRAPTTHHGLARIGTKQLEFRWVEESLERLTAFFDLLLGMEDVKAPYSVMPDLADTIFFFTATAVAARHPDRRDIPPLLVRIRSFLRTLITSRLCKSRRLPDGRAILKVTPATRSAAKLAATGHRSRCDERYRLLRGACAEWWPPGVDTASLPKWARVVVEFAQVRRLFREGRPAYDGADINPLGLLMLLSLFRRPRPMCVLRALLSRWLFDPGDLTGQGQMRLAFDSLDTALKAVESESLICRFEGDVIWLPREVHEDIYDCLTEPLRLRRLRRMRQTAGRSTVALLAGCVVSTLHLQIARVFFVEVYTASHGDDSFFEYIYHRVAGLRYLAYLDAILSGRRGPEALQRLEKVLATAQMPAGVAGIRDDEDATASISIILHKAGLSHVAGMIQQLAMFSFVRRDQHLISTLKKLSHRRARPSLRQCVEAIRECLGHSRRHGLATLRSAIRREADRITASATPDTWLRWIRRLVGEDLSESLGSWSSLPADYLPSGFGIADLTNQPPIARSGRALRRLLRELECRLSRNKLDYPAALKSAVAEIVRTCTLPDEYTAVFISWATGGAIRHDGAETFVGSKRVPVELWKATKTKTALGRPTALHLLKCWYEVVRSLQGLGFGATGGVILRRCRVLLETKVSVDAPSKFTDLYFDVLCAHCDRQLGDSVPMWSSLDGSIRRENPVNPSGHTLKVCMTVEKRTHQMEDFVRATSRTAAEYALRRARAFTLRGRALYLRGQFQEAHRVLDSAVSDLHDDNEEHRLARVAAYLCQAELLFLSAESHFVHNGRALPALRKVETGVRYIDKAATLLHPAVHRPLWWVRVFLGRAQMRHEQMLLLVSLVAEEKQANTALFAERSLAVEMSMRDGFRAIRNGLDSLPFVPGVAERSGPLVGVERKLFALWIQLCVVGFAVNHMLVTRLQISGARGQLSHVSSWHEYYNWTNRQSVELQAIVVDRIVDEITPKGFWRSKLQPWCEESQLNEIARKYGKLFDEEHVDGLIGRVFAGVGGKKADDGGDRGSRSLRADLLRMEQCVITDHQLAQRMMEDRRKPARR